MYKIYVDMDGVLVDFEKKKDSMGINVSGSEWSREETRVFWATVGAMAKRGEVFWQDMDPMKDAEELWNFVKGMDVEILTATGHVGNADPEKRVWAKRYLGDVKVNCVRKSSDKAQFASPNHILIDDRLKSIEPWVAAGGIGILHTSAYDSIQALQSILTGGR